MNAAVRIGSDTSAGFTIPPGIDSLDDFRRWVFSEEFPTTGRIDYINGTIEVDMSPQRLYSHGKIKLELARIVENRVRAADLGDCFPDQTLVTAPAAGLITEPDLLVLLHESIASGRVQLVPAAGDLQDAVEIVGGPDLVAEVVSPSSVAKDTRRLPAVYYAAGVTEYWLVDGRGEHFAFNIFRRGATGFEVTPADTDGFIMSIVLGCRYRFDRTRGRRGEWRYDLREQPAGA